MKHMIISKNGEYHYLCNQATSTIESKMTYSWASVTCKNCLKQYRNVKMTQPKGFHVGGV